ncbi:MAG TPA: transcription antitermination factor NusB [Usitatibacter sp.]|jgi:N utilization substance protein B|nr:transcription antitermination factor NusB [Usitatibacter sp.]
MRVSPRRRARELAMQGLYQWIYTGDAPGVVLRNLSELEGYKEADCGFLEAEVRGAINEVDGLRGHLEPLADRKWDEVSPVERAILLIGAWELVHNPEIPYRVTLNEAIELGKRFGGTDGHKYVNGVLDRLAANVRPAEVAERKKASK